MCLKLSGAGTEEGVEGWSDGERCGGVEGGERKKENGKEGRS